MFRFISVLLAVALLHAQEFARVTSPDGKILFVIDVAQPNEDYLPGLAYQIHYQGELLMATSYMGFDILQQEPMLGEKIGLSKATETTTAGSKTLLAEYLQQGSLGRRLNVEVRVSNRGVAFRYIIPPSAPLLDLKVRDEFTEFRFAKDARAETGALAAVPDTTVLRPPVAVQVPGAWVSIQEEGKDNFTLRHFAGNKLVLRLPRLPAEPELVLNTHTTWTSSWREILVGPTRESVQASFGLGR